MVQRRLSEELWYTEALSIFTQISSWTARLSPQLAARVYHRLAVQFQVLLTRSSLWRGRCACVSNKGWVLFSWTSEGDDIFFGLSCTDTTTLLEYALALPLDLVFVIALHCWLSIMSGWTHIVSSWGVRTGIKPFSFWYEDQYWSLLVRLLGWEPLWLVLVGDPGWIE